MLRRTLLVAGLVSAALAAPGAAGAQLPAQDSVSGTGLVMEPPPIVALRFNFEIDARSGPSGENPTGQVTLRMQIPVSGVVAGPVTCLVVDGNVATLNVQDPRGVVTLEITDSPSGDVIELAPTLRLPDDCSPVTGLSGDVIDGDVVVVDATPLPTSNEQCADGGWRNYPAFKNRGDCVSFVATGGKNHPSLTPSAIAPERGG